MQKQISLEQIFESAECWCSTNVRQQTVPCRRTSDAEWSVPETSSGTRDMESRVGGNSWHRHT